MNSRKLSKEDEEIILLAIKMLPGVGGIPVGWKRDEHQRLIDEGYLGVIERKTGLDTMALTRKGYFMLTPNFRHYIDLQTKDLKDMLSRQKRHQHVDFYLFERQSPFYHKIPNSRFCRSCFNVTKNHTCEKCNDETHHLDVRARPPRKDASKQRWQAFLEMFQPEVLENKNWWSDRK